MTIWYTKPIETPNPQTIFGDFPMSTLTVVQQAAYLVWLARVDRECVDQHGLGLESLPISEDELLGCWEDGWLASQVAGVAGAVRQGNYDGCDD